MSISKILSIPIPLPLSIHLSIHPSMHPFAHLSIHPSICLSIYLSIHLSIHLSILPFFHPSIYPPLHLSSSVHLFIYPSHCLSIYPPIDPSIHRAICLPINQFIPVASYLPVIFNLWDYEWFYSFGSVWIYIDVFLAHLLCMLRTVPPCSCLDCIWLNLGRTWPFDLALWQSLVWVKPPKNISDNNALKVWDGQVGK